VLEALSEQEPRDPGSLELSPQAAKSKATEQVLVTSRCFKLQGSSMNNHPIFMDEKIKSEVHSTLFLSQWSSLERAPPSH